MSGKKKALLIAAALLVFGMIILANLKKRGGGSLEVTVEEVKRGSITQTVAGTGKVQPEVEVKISAFVAGEIKKIYVREGDLVRKGQVLAELDQERYVAALDRAESNLRSAEAQLKKARADYDRVKELFARNLASRAELEAAEANLQLAHNQLEQAQANLREARDSLNKTRLISPIDGVVTRLNKEEGEIALGSQFQADVIMTVADLSKMEVRAEVDENDVVLVSVGDRARIEVDALPDTVLEGRVTEIAHSATTRGQGTAEEVTNFEVRVAITTHHPRLRPGMSATVDIETATHDSALYVPIQCVTAREVSDSTLLALAQKERKKWERERRTTPDQSVDEFLEESAQADKKAADSKKNVAEVVFVVEDGVAKMIPVRTGISSETDVEILSGVKEGQKVVSGPYRVLSQQLRDGMKVKVKSERPEKRASAAR
ncbi:MAG: efflux RND transporter periplasmic adaptor subunit [candidate division KSB1 bacterium]|nr:efflux RND transporter periplasmic adaptor subunit [candidate division KSB1 bacterium]